MERADRSTFGTSIVEGRWPTHAAQGIDGSRTVHPHTSQPRDYQATLLAKCGHPGFGDKYVTHDTMCSLSGK